MVVPNGVDVERFGSGAEARGATRQALGIPDAVLLVLFTASKWGPNQEAFEFIRSFAQSHERELVANRVHFLVVGGITDAAVQTPALTATGRVPAVEAYFAAADVGINPLLTGAGTNVKVGEYIAAKLPVLVTQFGARGYRIDDGQTGFVFDREHLLECLLQVRRMFDEQPQAVSVMTERAFSRNAALIDMTECVVPLVEFIAGRLGPGARLNPRPGHGTGAAQGPAPDAASEGVR
jgi:glycosyltransferase involved in cell wall biosynthesis